MDHSIPPKQLVQYLLQKIQQNSLYFKQQSIVRLRIYILALRLTQKKQINMQRKQLLQKITKEAQETINHKENKLLSQKQKYNIDSQISNLKNAFYKIFLSTIFFALFQFNNWISLIIILLGFSYYAYNLIFIPFNTMKCSKQILLLLEIELKSYEQSIQIQINKYLPPKELVKKILQGVQIDSFFLVSQNTMTLQLIITQMKNLSRTKQDIKKIQLMQIIFEEGMKTVKQKKIIHKCYQQWKFYQDKKVVQAIFTTFHTGLFFIYLLFIFIWLQQVSLNLVFIFQLLTSYKYLRQGIFNQIYRRRIIQQQELK